MAANSKQFGRRGFYLCQFASIRGCDSSDFLQLFAALIVESEAANGF
jgi:hypothetical protein